MDRRPRCGFDVQSAAGDGPGIDLIETGHGEIRAGFAEKDLITEASDAGYGHPTGARGLDARGSVFDNRALSGENIGRLRQEKGRICLLMPGGASINRSMCVL